MEKLFAAINAEEAELGSPRKSCKPLFDQQP
jgi:hypothetical protein